MVRTTCLDCLVSTVSDRSKKKKKKGKASSGHTTKFEQSISLDIYGIIQGSQGKRSTVCGMLLLSAVSW
jgi:hypothetical protein